MQPLKVIIADDEKEARELLLHYLPHGKHLETRQCADGKTVLKALQEFLPDILFLDIRMPELSGIEVLQKKKTTLLPGVILTTAFDEYALSAFDYEVLDYLLKPFERERFDKAWKKATDYVAFVKNKTTKSRVTQLPIKTGVKTELVNMDEIIYFRAEGSYVQVITADKAYLITEPIYELESLVDPSKFARVHRSVIVQINAIKTIQSLLNGDHILILKNGKEIRASRTYKDKINQMKLV
jgi:two-component system LytT family response regulator